MIISIIVIITLTIYRDMKFLLLPIPRRVIPSFVIAPANPAVEKLLASHEVEKE